MPSPLVAFTNPNYKRFDDDSNMVSSRSSTAQNSQTMLSVISFKPTWKNYKNWNSKSWYDESYSPSRLDISFQTFTHLQQGMPSTLCLLSFSKFQIPKLRKTTKTTQVLAILNHLANLNTKYSKWCNVAKMIYHHVGSCRTIPPNIKSSTAPLPHIAVTSVYNVHPHIYSCDVSAHLIQSFPLIPFLWWVLSDESSGAEFCQ